VEVLTLAEVPASLAGLLAGSPEVGAHEQAFPFLTVDDAGFPHVALLSRSELDVPADRSAVLAAIYSTRTRANLGRDGHAGLIAVGGTTAYYAKLRVTHSVELEGMLGCAMELVELKDDSYGIRLDPIGFTTTEQIAAMDRWESCARVLAALARWPGDG
jgi:hypothetical protein